MKILVRLGMIPFPVYLLVAGLLGYFAYEDWVAVHQEPLLLEIQSLEGQVQNAKLQNKKAEQFEREREEKLRTLTELGQKLKEVQGLIPTQPDLPVVLKTLADLAESSSLEFSSFQPEASVQQGVLVAIPIKVSVRGTYPQVLSFFDATSRSGRLISSEEMRFTEPRVRGSSTLVKVDGVFRVYYLGSEETEKDVVDPSAPGKQEKSAKGEGGSA